MICAGFRMRLLSHNPLSTPCPPLLGVYKRKLGDTPKPSAGTRPCTLVRMIRSETGENPKPWQRSAGPSWSGPESSPNSWGIIGNAEGLGSSSPCCGYPEPPAEGPSPSALPWGHRCHPRGSGNPCASSEGRASSWPGTPSHSRQSGA